MKKVASDVGVAGKADGTATGSDVVEARPGPVSGLPLASVDAPATTRVSGRTDRGV